MSPSVLPGHAEKAVSARSAGHWENTVAVSDRSLGNGAGEAGFLERGFNGERVSHVLFNRARRLYANGSFRKAAKALKTVYEANRDHKWLLLNYALCIRNAGHVDFAMRVLDWLRSQFPEVPLVRECFEESREKWERMEGGADPRRTLGVRSFTWKPGFPQPDLLVDEDFFGFTLSLCAIVRNEEGNIGRMIESVRDAVDEIVVVDTGSTDGTVSVLERMGVTPHRFEWCDDFSKARNHSLSKATKDWILVLDADETISFHDFFTLKEAVASTPDTWGIALEQRDYSSLPLLGGFSCEADPYPESKPYRTFAVQEVCRLFRNDDRIRFVHPVYEMVEESIKLNGGDFGYLDVPIHHYGRTGPMPQQAAKRRYYIDILQRRLAATNETNTRKSVYATQIARAHMFLRELDEAEEYFLRAVRFDAESPLPLQGLGSLAALRRQFTEAVQWYERCIAVDRQRPVDTPYLRAAECYYRLGDFGSAIEMCERCLRVCPRSTAAASLLEHLQGGRR